MTAPVRSSPVAALGALVALLAISTLASSRSEERISADHASSEPARHRPALGAPIDVNVASAEELERLPRIGPTLASRIVEHRQTNGPFLHVEDLDAVSGIGPSVLAAIRDHVTVSSPSDHVHALPRPSDAR